MEAGELPPLILVAPSSTVKSEVFRGASWRRFDLDHFVRLSRRALNGYGRIDPRRIVPSIGKLTSASPSRRVPVRSAKDRTSHSMDAGSRYTSAAVEISTSA